MLRCMAPVPAARARARLTLTLAAGLATPALGCHMDNPAFVSAESLGLGSDGSGGDSMTSAGASSPGSESGAVSSDGTGGGGQTSSGTSAELTDTGSSSSSSTGGGASVSSGVGSSTGELEPCFEPEEPAVDLWLEKNGEPVCADLSVRGLSYWDPDDERIHIWSCPEPDTCGDLPGCDDYALDLWIHPDHEEYYSELLESGCLTYFFRMYECGKVSSMLVWFLNPQPAVPPLYAVGVHEVIEGSLFVEPQPVELCDEGDCEGDGAGIYELAFTVGDNQFSMGEGATSSHVIQAVSYDFINLHSRISPACDPPPQFEWIAKANF